MSVVTTITDEQEFQNLRPDWNALVHEMDAPSVFLEHEWFEAAWSWRRSIGDSLYILCVRENRTVIGVCPLVRTRRREFGISHRVLEFLAVPDSQDCDVITSRLFREIAIRAIARELRRRSGEWDVLQFDKVPLGSDLFSRLIGELEGLPLRRETAGYNSIVALNESWQEYYGRRSRRLKKGNNSIRNQLKNSHESIEVKWLRGGDESEKGQICSAIGTVIALSADSWKGRDSVGLNEASRETFIRVLTNNAMERGWTSIFLLELDGVPVAMEYQLIHGGRAYALRADFDERYRESGVGTYLNWRLLESLFAAGLTQNFMGPGDNTYKSRWASDIHKLERLRVFGGTLTGSLLASIHLLAKPVLRRLRSVLSQLRMRQQGSTRQKSS